MKKTLSEYIQTNQFKIMRNIIIILTAVVLICVSFLSGLFFKKKHNINYDMPAAAVTAPVQTTPAVTAPPSEPLYTTVPVTEKPQVTQTQVPVVCAGFILDAVKNMDGSIFSSEYNYTASGVYENCDTYKNYNVPLTKKSFRMSFDGTVTAAIDSADIDIKTDEASKTIYVYIPKAYIQSNTVLQESIAVSDKKESVFSEITEADYTEFMETQKLSMQEKAVQSGLLEDLYADVSENIENLVYDDKAVKEYYKVVIISS